MKNLNKSIAVFLCIILTLSLAVNAAAENTNSWKNKIDEKIYEEANKKSDKIPVYIWITDVNHDEVIEKTESELGYGEADLAVIDENMSEELAADIATLSENPTDKTVKEEIRAYMNKTKNKRAKEKEKTEKYIGEKRKNYKEEYNKNSKSFLEKAKINDEDIVFTSQYAPMIIAELTIKQIEKLTKTDNVKEISYYNVTTDALETESTLDEIKTSTKIQIIHETLGLDGSGVKAGILDNGYIDFDVSGAELPADRFEVLHNSNETTADHVIGVATICFGESGVAPGVDCYVCSYGNYSYSCIENLLSKGASIITCSLKDSRGENESYTNQEKWIDHVASVHSVSFVKSAGNNDIIISSPGLAYNVITVGAYDNCGTISNSDDVMFNYSCHDELTGCAKPDLIAPANMLGGGTSSAAPFVAGIIALMLEVRPSLAAYPQVIKSILLASCHHKALPAAGTGDSTETMSQGLTDKQGAGVVDPYRAVSITGRGNYGMRILSGTSSTSIRLNLPTYNATGLNVSIAWLRLNTLASGSDHYSVNDVIEAPAHNLNLSLLGGSSVLKSSSNTNSSTEMVYLSNPSSATTYTIKIDKVDSASGYAKVGFAWSLDDENFQYSDEYEGLYYLRNGKSGYCLTLNSSQNTISQSSYSGNTNQIWILQKSTNDNYRLNCAYMNTGCLNVGTLLSNRFYNNVLNSNNTAEINVVQNSDGSLSFYKLISGVKYYLVTQDNSTENGASVGWLQHSSSADLTSSLKWHIDRICYRKGDANMDWDITAADSRDVLNYAGALTDFTNAQIYLADVNNDKTVTAADSRIILRMSAGLE